MEPTGNGENTPQDIQHLVINLQNVPESNKRTVSGEPARIIPAAHVGTLPAGIGELLGSINAEFYDTERGVEVAMIPRTAEQLADALGVSPEEARIVIHAFSRLDTFVRHGRAIRDRFGLNDDERDKWTLNEREKQKKVGLEDNQPSNADRIREINQISDVNLIHTAIAIHTVTHFCKRRFGQDSKVYKALAGNPTYTRELFTGANGKGIPFRDQHPYQRVATARIFVDKAVETINTMLPNAPRVNILVT